VEEKLPHCRGESALTQSNKKWSSEGKYRWERVGEDGYSTFLLNYTASCAERP
jgi:hypothetical protein